VVLRRTLIRHCCCRLDDLFAFHRQAAVDWSFQLLDMAIGPVDFELDSFGLLTESKVQCEVILVALPGGAFHLSGELSVVALNSHDGSDRCGVDSAGTTHLDFEPMTGGAGISKQSSAGNEIEGAVIVEIRLCSLVRCGNVQLRCLREFFKLPITAVCIQYAGVARVDSCEEEIQQAIVMEVCECRRGI
jgi:hypothetical protein